MMWTRLLTLVILVIATDVVWGLSKCGKNGIGYCTEWDYIDTCGSDCRSFRWRSCPKVPGTDEPCDVEDDRPPCWYVEWGEWSDCSKDNCERTRSEECKCNGVTVDNEKICKSWLKTMTEKCTLVPAWTSWSECDHTCHRTRTPKCMCGKVGQSTDSTPQPFLVSPPFCDLEDEDDVEDCSKEIEWSAWSKCDDRCDRSREASCVCDGEAQVDNKYCGLNDYTSVEPGECAREWDQWRNKECPPEEPGRCVAYTSRFRDCQCKPTADYPFLIDDHLCGTEPTDGSHVCDYGCECNPVFKPVLCPKKCVGPNIAIAPKPTCECTPAWHSGSCDPALMNVIQKKECPLEPSDWEDWTPWSACDRRSCKKKRTRKCICAPDDPTMRQETVLCKGNSEEYEDCKTVINWSTWSICGTDCQRTRAASCDCGDAEAVDIAFCGLDGYTKEEPESCAASWTDWTNMRCPMQMEGQCTVSSKRYRQCQCQEGKQAYLTDAHCVGDSRSEYPCPFEACQCHWVPVLTTCPPELSCVARIKAAEYECECTPKWYGPNTKWGGACADPKPEAPDNICEATVEYDWEEWGPWGACDSSCQKTRTRSCICLGDVDNKACGYGASKETEDCDTEWSDWTGPSCNPRCLDYDITQTRRCICKANPYASLPAGHCGADYNREITCPRKEYGLGPWSEWTDHRDDPMMMCMTYRTRDCECYNPTAYGEPYVYNPALCDGQGEVEQNKVIADLHWTDWSEPECGDPGCSHKIRPRYRYCECDMPEGMIGRVHTDHCPYTRHEMGVKCPVRDDCSSTSDVVHINELLTKDLVHQAYGNEAVVEEEEDLPEIPVEEELPELPVEEDLPELPAGLNVVSSCECDTWVNISACTGCSQEVWRNCQPEGCDVELDVEEGCCRDCDPGSTFDSVFETCVPCPVQTFKAERGPEECTDCPEGFLSNEGARTESECEDPCAGCGPWIDVGACPEEPGSYQWRSNDNPGCHDTCPEFECVTPEGDDFDPCSTCGQWLDAGPCPDGAPGQYQWRSVAVCDCEEYRCVIQH